MDIGKAIFRRLPSTGPRAWLRKTNEEALQIGARCEQDDPIQ